MALLPYIGPWQELHFRKGAQSRPSEYDFNSLGFRSDEPDPTAVKKIFACGCSYTFGVGLTAQQTWPHRFAKLYSEHLSIPASRISVMNFSQCGASNEYISRTLISQSAAERPDLVIAHFTHIERLDYYLNESDRNAFGASEASVGFVSIGPWLAGSGDGPGITDSGQISRNTRRLGKRLRRWAKLHYEDLLTPENALANALHHLLLLQFFCASQSIPLLCCCIDHKFLFGDLVRSQPALAHLASLLDRRVIMEIGLRDKEVYVDRSSVRDYPGSASHSLLAQALWNRFCEYITIPVTRL